MAGWEFIPLFCGNPMVSRFLSPVPIVQSSFAQSFNRYSYVVNNPLSFIDPGGYSREHGMSRTHPDNIPPANHYEGYAAPYYGNNPNSPGYYPSFGGAFSGFGGSIGNPFSIGGGDWVRNFGKMNYWDYQAKNTLDLLKSRRLVYKLDRYVEMEFELGRSSGSKTGYYYEWFLDGKLIDAESWGFVRPAANGGGGSGWEAYVGGVIGFGEYLYNPNKGGNWVGKDFKIRSTSWGGNGATGGKYKFSGKVGTGFKVGGSILGIYNAGTIYNQYTDGEINGAQLGIEQTSNAISTFGGIYGAAWGVGWDLGAKYGDRVPIPAYQRFKQNVVYPWRLKHFGY